MGLASRRGEPGAEAGHRIAPCSLIANGAARRERGGNAGPVPLHHRPAYLPEEPLACCRHRLSTSRHSSPRPSRTLVSSGSSKVTVSRKLFKENGPPRDRIRV